MRFMRIIGSGARRRFGTGRWFGLVAARTWHFPFWHRISINGRLRTLAESISKTGDFVARKTERLSTCPRTCRKCDVRDIAVENPTTTVCCQTSCRTCWRSGARCCRLAKRARRGTRQASRAAAARRASAVAVFFLSVTRCRPGIFNHLDTAPDSVFFRRFIETATRSTLTSKGTAPRCRPSRFLPT